MDKGGRIGQGRVVLSEFGSDFVLVILCVEGTASISQDWSQIHYIGKDRSSCLYSQMLRLQVYVTSGFSFFLYKVESAQCGACAGSEQ